MDVEYTTVGLENQPGDRNWSVGGEGRVRSRVRIVHDEARTVLGPEPVRAAAGTTRCSPLESKRSASSGGWSIHLPDASFDTELVPPLRIPVEARP
jgi:hypothetical protein